MTRSGSPFFYWAQYRLLCKIARRSQIEHLGGQHDIAVLAALGLLDPNDVLCAVDVLDLQPDHLAGAQAAAISETEQHTSLEAAGHCQQAARLVLAHHQRNLLRLPDVIDLGGKVQPPQ